MAKSNQMNSDDHLDERGYLILTEEKDTVKLKANSNADAVCLGENIFFVMRRVNADKVDPEFRKEFGVTGKLQWIPLPIEYTSWGDKELP